MGENRGVGGNALTVDHLNSDAGDNRPENLVPSCHPCNCQRGMKQTIRDGETFVVAKDGTRRRTTKYTCLVCGQSFMGVLARRGRYCSRECFYNRTEGWPTRFARDNP